MATSPSSQTLNLVDVLPGTRLRTKAGRQIEVVENPEDGIWLLCSAVDEGAPADAPATGPIEPVFAQDIDGLA